MQKCNCTHHKDCPARDSPQHAPRPFPNLVWGPNAAYAPGFRIHDLQTRRSLPDVVEYRHVLPKRKTSVPTPDSVPKVVKAALLASLPGILSHGHLPKSAIRHVRFDLSSSGKERKRENEKEPKLHKDKHPPVSSHTSHRSSHRESRIPLPKPEPPRKSHTDHRSSHHHHGHRHIRSDPRPNPPSIPSLPTIHIISYSVNHTPRRIDVERIFTKHLPPGTHHLYTIPAYRFTPPSERICQRYSGVSPIVQDIVMCDPQALLAVKDAIADLTSHASRKWDLTSRAKPTEGRKGDVAVGVCCMYGTHRSVSVAERIARGVEQWVAVRAPGRVKVRVVHVHRVKGVMDPY